VTGLTESAGVITVLTKDDTASDFSRLITTNETYAIATTDNAAAILSLATNRGGSINSGATVTFDWDDGTHSYTNAVDVGAMRRAFTGGGAVHFVGNIATSASCRLIQTDASDACVEIGVGAYVELFDGFYVSGVGSNQANTTHFGIYVRDGAQLYCGDEVSVRSNRTAVHVTGEGSFINYDNNDVRYSYMGIEVFNGASASWTNGMARYNDKHGVLVDHHGYLYAPYCFSRDNGGYGLYASSFSGGYLRYGRADDNGQDGVRATRLSFMDCRNFDADDNGGYGYYANGMGGIEIGTGANNASGLSGTNEFGNTW